MILIWINLHLFIFLCYRIQRTLRPLGMDRGVKLSFMPFFLKAASMALLEFPMLNASFDEENMNMIYKVCCRCCCYCHRWIVVIVVFELLIWSFMLNTSFCPKVVSSSKFTISWLFGNKFAGINFWTTKASTVEKVLYS